MNHRNIKSHYNSLKGVSLKDRHKSKIIKIRKMNNFIKSVLIRKYTKTDVLDLGCGKGGDLKKFLPTGIKYYCGIDIADQSIKEAESRYLDMCNKEERNDYEKSKEEIIKIRDENKIEDDNKIRNESKIENENKINDLNKIGSKDNLKDENKIRDDNKINDFNKIGSKDNFNNENQIKDECKIEDKNNFKDESTIEARENLNDKNFKEHISIDNFSQENHSKDENENNHDFNQDKDIQKVKIQEENEQNSNKEEALKEEQPDFYTGKNFTHQSSQITDMRKNLFKAQFHCIDAYNDNFNIGHLFSTISCQFSFHYAFSSEETFNTALININNHLKEGGNFLMTIPNSNTLLRRYHNHGNNFGNQYYKVKFKDDYKDIKDKKFGVEYYFVLEEAIDNCVEYLIDFDEMEKGLKRFNIECIVNKDFLTFFNQNVKQNIDLYNVMVRNKLNTDELKVIELYSVVVFKKQKITCN